MKSLQLKKVAEKILLKDFTDVEVINCDEVFAEKKSGKRKIGGANTPQKLRAFSLLCINDECGDFSVTQEPKFNQVGVMLDVSRNGVMRVEKVKEYITRLAMFGANELLLYTEDIYTLEEYPHFGYCRGAYTDEELREIDDYAFSLDVEIIPCIQTLGHMNQYLSWGLETQNIKDTAGVLLCDSEETYKFIDAEIAKMRKVFRSRQIHIGMDEAHDVGLGKYLRENGFTDRYDLLKRHLAKVVEISKKYDFTPMMWSDMFFKLSSTTDTYYNFDANYHLPKSVIADIPDTKMVYWDYYTEFEDGYQNMVRLHNEMGKPIVFAGGIWTWCGFLPNYKKNERSMVPALKVCRKEKIENVFATMWGDDGCETDLFRALYDFAYFSEYCYSEEEPTKEQIEKMGELVSGVSSKYIDEIAKFHSISGGKGLIWGNIFYNLTGTNFSETEHIAVYESALESGELEKDEFAKLVFRIAILKAKVYIGLQNDYKQKFSLEKYEKELLPKLLDCYERLYELHRENWYEVNKCFGFECLETRYAAMIFSIKSAIKTLNMYANGKINNIEELEYNPLYGEGRGNYFNKCFIAGV